MRKSQTTNTFNKGMIMDLNPIVTPNDSLVNCLNGTLITYNGNENVLQNDIGNGRVETAYLPQGYVPLGTAELGGIMYIVSYNPITKKSQIGSFPSPERNITTDELESPNTTLILEDLYESSVEKNQFLKSKFKKLILLDDFLHPGDKFQIACTQVDENTPDTPQNPFPEEGNIISGKHENNKNPDLYPKYLKLNVVAIQDNGIINNLNKSLIWHDNNYYILGSNISRNTDGSIDLDEYRNLIQSNYNVFDSKVDGKLAILAELECIDNFSVSWTAVKKETSTQNDTENNNWNIYLYLNWTYDNNSAQDKINLYGLYIEKNNKDGKSYIIKNYPKSNYNSDNDILNNENTDFYTPNYIDDSNIDNIDQIYAANSTIKRRNDGSDNDFLFSQSLEVSQKDSGVTFDIYPTMPFGILEWLKQSIYINVEDLGSGKINLTKYKYYYNGKNNITLNYGLNAYVEKNKKINSLTFKFYEYNDDIKSYIKDNAKYIQNDYSVNSKWNDDTDDSFKFSPSKTQSISGPIRSGNKTINLTNLDDNKLYLVKIVIDYNGEKIICYYRFMYTFEIFNSSYIENQINDFKDIKLDDALNNAIKISIKNIVTDTNKNTTDKCIDSSGNETTNFEQYVNNEETLDYTIKSDYNSHVSFDSEASIIYTGLQTDINNFNINGNISNSFSYGTISQTMIRNSNNESSPGNFNKTISSTSSVENIKLSNIHSSFDYFSEVDIPLQIIYNNLSYVNANYQLNPLTIRCKWLLCYGQRKSIDLYLSDIYKISDSNTNRFTGDDDTSSYGSINNYKVVYEDIKKELSSCDVLALRFRTHHNARAGGDDEEGNYTVWGTGNWHAGSSNREAYFDYNIYYNTDDKEDDGINLPLYCFLDNNDNVQILAFAKSGAHNSQWHGIAAQSPFGTSTNKTYNWQWSSDCRPFGFIQKSLTDSILKAPFEKYYKLANSSDSIKKYVWSILYYYNAGTWKDTISIPVSLTITLKVNDTELQNISEIYNLNYSNVRTDKITIDISNFIDTKKWTDKITSNSSTTSIVKLPDESFKQIEISTNSLYDIEGNKVDNIKIEDGTDTQLSQLHDTLHTISYKYGKVLLTPKFVTGQESKSHIGVIARSEDQSITIDNIIQVPSN